MIYIIYNHILNTYIVINNLIKTYLSTYLLIYLTLCLAKVYTCIAFA